jgi:chromosomal replication initiation ATPase DnaA
MEEIAHETLRYFASRHAVLIEDFTQGGELSESLAQIRREAILKLRTWARAPLGFIVELLHLRDELHAMEELELAKATHAKEVEIHKEGEAWRWDAMSILLQVAEAYGCTPEELLGDGRKQEIVSARHLLMYRLREELNLSFLQIGSFVNRDHTSVIHGYYRVKRERLEKVQTQGGTT